MKLLYQIILRISIALLILFAAWAVIFYNVIVDEINDETDDSLEDYSEYIITRALAGEELPAVENGTNNSYYINEVSDDYAENHPSVRFLDEEVYIYSKRETEPARIFKTIFRDREDRKYELTVLIPTIEKADLKTMILVWIVVLYLVLLVSILLVNAFVLRRSLRPLYVLLNWLDNMSLDKHIQKPQLDTDIKEFRKLSDSLLRNAERNAQMYEEQSRFIGNASHELQTPIAIAINRLELLADDSSLNESQLRQVLKTRKSLEDIAKLNKTLLLLTRIENGQITEDNDVDVNDMIRTLGEDFSEAYGHLGIHFELREHAQLKVRMNKMLASVLLSNLMKNAFIHNHRGGAVSVEVDSRGVSISNSAYGEALNPEYIFSRFYQGEGTEGSAGLGLSLVESIAKLYSVSVTYRYEGSMHIFDVKFPERRKILS